MTANGYSIKCGVQYGDSFTKLLAIDTGKPLSTYIDEVCREFNLQPASDFCFSVIDGHHICINEENRHLITNGSVLHLKLSPKVMMLSAVRALSSTKCELVKEALRDLAVNILDLICAQEFIQLQGHSVLFGLIAHDKRSDAELSALLLQVFNVLIEYIVTDDSNDKILITWKHIGNACIQAVIVHLQNSQLDIPSLKAASEILVSFVEYCSDRASIVTSNLDPSSLLSHIKRIGVNNHTTEVNNILRNLLCLLNTFFEQVSRVDREELYKAVNLYLSPEKLKGLIEAIPTLQEGTNAEPSADLNAQLVRLQYFMLSPLTQDMYTPLDANDQRVVQQMETLLALIKPKEFQHRDNPIADFANCPPGCLAFKCLFHVAFHYEHSADKALDNDVSTPANRFPLVRATKLLANILCKLLGIGQDWLETNDRLYPMLFSALHNKPFEETYHAAIVVFHRTWHDMEATIDDMAKVERVIEDQVSRALSHRPRTVSSFSKQLLRLSAKEINSLWLLEKSSRDEVELQSPAISDLRESLKQRTIELIKNKRLHKMVEGDLFVVKEKSKGSSKDKQVWTMNLSSNHKCLVHTYTDERQLDKSEAFQVAHIQQVMSGRNCPLANDKRFKLNFPNWQAFCISVEFQDPDKPESRWLNMVAQSENTYHTWVDALNVLTNLEMSSPLFDKDLDTLLSLEMKIRLLDLDGRRLPSRPPEVPEPPASYDFCLEQS